MDITKNESKILNIFRKNLFLKASIRELMVKADSKAYSRVHEAAVSLIKKGILHSERIGQTNLISLEFSRLSIVTLAYMDEIESIALPNYEEIAAIKDVSDFLILVTGSYASGKQTKRSDMDIVVVVPDKEDVVSIQNFLENRIQLLLPPVHIYVLRKIDFLDMLRSSDENFGKEVVKNRKVIKNAQIFYDLVKEAIESGYKGERIS